MGSSSQVSPRIAQPYILSQFASLGLRWMPLSLFLCESCSLCCFYLLHLYDLREWSTTAKKWTETWAEVGWKRWEYDKMSVMTEMKKQTVESKRCKKKERRKERIFCVIHCICWLLCARLSCYFLATPKQPVTIGYKCETAPTQTVQHSTFD